MQRISDQNDAFDKAYEKLIQTCYGGSQKPQYRPNDITLNTLADTLYTNKRQRL